jgi:hypothetical protein
MFSGGIGSWMTAKRVVAEHGPESVTMLFADVGGKHDNPHVGEDPDVYRFLHEAAERLGARLVVLNEGRTIWEVFKDRRFIGNARLAVCSHELKQRPCRRWLDENCDPEVTTVYIGIDWSEVHRVAAIERAYQPFRVRVPLTEPPYLDKRQMLDAAKAEGLEPPRMYRQGWPHANCQGGCVRAGQAQWRKLLQLNPDAYAYHENQEHELRNYLGKNVAILREHMNGESTPLTLREFRERLDSQLPLFDDYDWGGCGCFTDYPEGMK